MPGRTISGGWIMFVTEVMQSSFATVKPSTSLDEVARLLLQTNQRGLPELDDEGSLLGIISEGDLLHRDELGVRPPTAKWLEGILGAESSRQARERMRALHVETIMTRKPICVEEDATVDEVVELMDRLKVGQIPVVMGSIVIGLVTRTQLIAALERSLREKERSDAPSCCD